VRLLRQSGGQFEVTSAARDPGIARSTVEIHLRVLENTHAAAVVRPFHGGGRNEPAKQPKVYGCDTGMVSFARGWDPLRRDDFGVLCEHLVLEHLQAHSAFAGAPDARVRRIVRNTLPLNARGTALRKRAHLLDGGHRRVAGERRE